MDDVVVGVLGASGGLGASTLAVTLAVRAGGRYGVAVAVDGEPVRGGLDVTACLEHEAGLRWGDLTSLEGDVDGPGLLRSLPAERNARFLAGGAGGAPGGPVVRRVVAALAVTASLVVVDCGTRDELLDLCTHVVLLCGTSVRQLADGTACAAALHARGVPSSLVVRGAGRHPVDPEEVAFHLDLPLAAILRDDARVAADPARGRTPGTRPGDVVGTVSDRLLDDVLDDGRHRGPGPAVRGRGGRGGHGRDGRGARESA